MMAFRAMLLDAYRQLSAAKLFWLTLGLSVLVVIVFGSIGFNEQGMSVFFGLWDIESEYVYAGSPWARGLYLGIYSNFLVTVWLAWIATVLALISTCTIFPEFVHSGAIELSLSKPVGRARLFFTKYAVSLLFVFMQVFVFCVGIFLCVGLRLGEWNWMIFAAVPLVTVFFSYLFAVCVLVGMVTRSGITALLITAVFWMSLWSSQFTEVVLNRFVTDQRVTIERFEEGIAKEEAYLATIKGAKSTEDARIQRRRERIASFRQDIEESKILFDELEQWHQPVAWVLAFLPKTGQTIGLLDRWLKDPDGFDLSAMMRGDMGSIEEMEEFDPTTRGARERELGRRMEEEYESRSLWYVLGTSLLFEGFVLAIAVWYFKRKDF